MKYGPLFLLFLSIACSSPSAPPQATRPSETDKPPSSQAEESGEDVAVIETYAGRIVIGFFADDAPKTVANFRNLARTGFYNRTTFHRVVSGMVIQGGDPLSADNNPWNDGQGNSGWFIPVEINKHKHVRGAVSAVRVTGTDTSTCQFFISLRSIPRWDSQFTVFGEVLEGLEVADKISRAPTRKEDPRYKELPVDKQLVRSIKIVKKSALPAPKAA